MAHTMGMMKHMPGAMDMEVEMPDEIMMDMETSPLDDATLLTVDIVTGELAQGEEMDEATAMQMVPFGSNLAAIMDEEASDEMGSAILEMVKVDIEARRPWYEKLKRGMERLGIYDPDSALATGIAKVSHPLLLEAATQFQARAMTELLPSGGPVKTTPVGLETTESVAQGMRVEKYMNYQLMVEDRDYYDERDQMLFLLPFTGSEFDKQYFDAGTGHVVSRWVRCDDFVVPYNTKNLREASRYTHIIRMTGAALRAKMASGMYFDVDLGEPVDTDASAAPLTVKLNELDGQEKTTTLDDDKEYVLYETHLDYDVVGLEEASQLPFVATIDSDTGKLLGLYRNWREVDPLKQKRIWFTHKKFLPGFGFYGFGLLHCIGNLGDAASEILQILIDSGAFATLQGGFKSIDAKMKGDVILQPGVWNDTEMTAEELSRAFYTPPWKEPSQVLENLLGTLVSAGQKFASTTETMTGDAATTGPVGTMVAQIEQGSKVFSGIHKRLHKAFGDEFIHIAELNGENLPEAYPYRMSDDTQYVLRADFDSRIDVIPVSDPNIFSSAQRIAMSQAALQLANQLPDLGDRREAAVQLLTAMRFPNPEKIFPKPQEAERADPLSEGSLLLMGRPIKAYVDQDHPSHISVHMGQMQGLPQQNQPLMQAHLFEHMAMEQYKKFASMGLPLPALDWGAEKKEPMMPQMSPEQENQLAVASAQAMKQILDEAQAKAAQEEAAKNGPQADPAQQAQAKQALYQQAQQQKDEAFQKEQGRKDAALAAQVDRQDALEGISPAMVKQAQEFINQQQLQMSPRELAVMAKALGAPFAKVVEALSRMQMAGQGGTQFNQLTDFTNNPARYR